MRRPTRSDAVSTIAFWLIVAALVCLPGPAEACCTAFGCPFCVSDSSDCICGPNFPVCNTFGCNCNHQCGQMTLNTNLRCNFYPTCDDSSIARSRFDEIDSDHGGSIDFDEAVAWFQERDSGAKNLDPSAPDFRDTLRLYFTRTDTDGNGFITPSEFDSSLSDGEEGAGSTATASSTTSPR